MELSPASVESDGRAPVHVSRARAGAAWAVGLPLAQYLLHCVDAVYDLLRFLRCITPSRSRTTDRVRLQALLFLNYHKIEKGLALSSTPTLFAVGALRTLLDLLDRWVESIGDTEAVVFQGSAAALAAYRARVGDQLRLEHPSLARRLDERLAWIGRWGVDKAAGGTTGVTATAVCSAAKEIDFERLAYLRRSVRHFSDEQVPDDVIAHAVRTAQRTPSDCNRQPWRVHIYTSPEDKKQVLKVQNGNSGFGHLAARVLLITADARVFATSGERHQAYVDGGMFAMTLIFALQAQGVASCCLNLSRYCFQEIAVRRACAIPVWEFPIMMLAIGFPSASSQVPVSARLPAEAVLSWRKLQVTSDRWVS
jgi:nitroreductase